MVESLVVLLIIVIAITVMLGQGRRLGGCLSKTFKGIFSAMAGCAIVIILILIVGGMMLAKVNSFFAGIFGGGHPPPALDQNLTVSLSLEPSSPIAIGNTLKIQVKSPLRSDVSVQVKDESGNIETLSATAFQHLYEWKPSKEGNFAVLATAQRGKTVGPTAKESVYVLPKLSAVSLTTDPKATGMVDSQVTIKANPTGGTHVEYRFLVDGHEIHGFSDDSTVVWKTQSTGNHTITVVARDKYSQDISVETKIDYQVTKIIPVAFLPQQISGSMKNNCCGYTSLVMAASYVRTLKPEEEDIIEVLDFLNLPRDGSALSSSQLMVKAGNEMQKYRLNIHGAKYTYQQLATEVNAGHPVIAGVVAGDLPDRGYPYAGAHFVVVLGFDGDSVVCNDPGTRNGKQKHYGHEEFQKAFENDGGVVVSGF